MLRFCRSKPKWLCYGQIIAAFLYCFYVFDTITAFKAIAPHTLTGYLAKECSKRAFKICENSAHNQDPDDSFKGLNPFEKRSSFGAKGYSGAYSLRQVTLTQIMSNLLSTVHSDDEMRAILLENENFIMEQYDDLETFLESESIFTSAMNRFERFDQYKIVMAERIAKAKNGSVKKILQCMTNFVLEHDERRSEKLTNMAES